MQQELVSNMYNIRDIKLTTKIGYGIVNTKYDNRS
jgi:hypothetical protein